MQCSARSRGGLLVNRTLTRQLDESFSPISTNIAFEISRTRADVSAAEASLAIARADTEELQLSLQALSPHCEMRCTEKYCLIFKMGRLGR